MASVAKQMSMFVGQLRNTDSDSDSAYNIGGCGDNGGGVTTHARRLLSQ